MAKSGENKVLMSNHRDTDPKEASKMRRIMESFGFEVTEMLFDVHHPKPLWNWAYVNYLQVGNLIVMPTFGIEEDKQALEYIKNALKYSPEDAVLNIELAGLYQNLGDYQNAISESENMKLRQIFQQIRDTDESFQYELFKIAENKGYYKPAQKVTITEIDNVKNELQK